MPLLRHDEPLGVRSSTGLPAITDTTPATGPESIPASEVRAAKRVGDELERTALRARKDVHGGLPGPIGVAREGKRAVGVDVGEKRSDAISDPATVDVFRGGALGNGPALGSDRDAVLDLTDDDRRRLAAGDVEGRVGRFSGRVRREEAEGAGGRGGR